MSEGTPPRRVSAIFLIVLAIAGLVLGTIIYVVVFTPR